MKPRLAVLDTRIPKGTAFLIRDLTALMDAGLVIDLYLLDPASLDPGLREAVRAAGGTVHPVPLPWSPAGMGALLREAVTHPLRLAASLGTAAALLPRAPREAMRSLGVLPGALHAGRAIRRSGAVQVHGLWAGVPATACFWIARHHHVPFSFSAHAWDLTVQTRLLPRKVRAATGVVVCSEWGRRTLAALAGEDAAQRVRLVHHGIDLSEWSFQPRPRAGTPPLILGVGRLTRVKGFDDLVRAAGHLARRGVPFRCEIIGADDRGWGRELDALVTELGLAGSVTLAGERTSAEVRAAMSRADLLVCPFIDRESRTSGSRGIPNVVPEAMALGTPVIATDAGGMRELVRDGETGRIIPQRDPEALAAAVVYALSDTPGTARMVRAARALVEETNDLAGTTRAFLEATGLARQLDPAGAPR